MCVCVCVCVCVREREIEIEISDIMAQPCEGSEQFNLGLVRLG